MNRVTAPTLVTPRLVLRPLVSSDWDQWREVRIRGREWLERWEPRRPPGAVDPAVDRDAFTARCGARERERQLGSAYSFGSFTQEGRFIGEININNVLRSAFMSAHVGYWVDESVAGQGYTPEGIVAVFRFAFEHVKLHRLQVSIVPRNKASRRVADKLGLREEGIAQRYLLINGVWEDHVRYAITAEEWVERRSDLVQTWLGEAVGPTSG